MIGIHLRGYRLAKVRFIIDSCLSGAGMKFQQEKIADIYLEALPLLEEHWHEIAHYQDIVLDPDWKSYFSLEEAGAIKCYTVRDKDHLIGYACYFVRTNMHYRNSLQAVQDVLFIKKEKRGQGREFIAWCDEQLKSEGIEVVYQHVKAAHNWGAMLEKMDYELVDLIYAKRLN